MDKINEWLQAWVASAGAEAPVILRGPVEVAWPRVEADIAKLVMCTQGGCDNCPDCKKIHSGVHPDVLRFPDSEKTLKVKQVRETREQWIMTPFGRRRLIIIPRAERLTTEAANALLKELEEPTKHNRFLLWTSFASRLPATIRSRSQFLRIPKQYIGLVEKSNINGESLLSWKRKQPFTEEELLTIYQFLQRRAQQGAVDSSWYRAALRLRDFYQVTSLQGNTKLATDVLLASLQELRYQWR